MKPKSATPISPGSVIGMITLRSVCHWVAPWSRAASSSLGSSRLNTASMISTPKGSVQLRCAPRAPDHHWLVMPRFEKPSPMPRLIRIDGQIRLATTM